MRALIVPGVMCWLLELPVNRQTYFSRRIISRWGAVVVKIAKEYLLQATDFVIEKNIVTMPDDPVEIIVIPEFQRGVTVAYLDPPGPLDKGQVAFYAVAPLPAEWTEEQIMSYLRAYNMLSIQDLTIHEGVPGHYLQLALSNRYPSSLRAVLSSGPMVEGWDVYTERIMIDEVYLDHDPLMRLIIIPVH